MSAPTRREANVSAKNTTTCTYTQARMGQLGGARCPACGGKAETHVRGCEKCGCDIAAKDAESMIDHAGRLLCDDCVDCGCCAR